MKTLCATLSLSLSLLAAGGMARAETYYVAEDGDDGAAGASAAPWATLQHAAQRVVAGDEVVVRPGRYVGFNLGTSGTESAPIHFRAEDGAVVDRDNPDTPDGINVEGVSYVVVEGFTVTGTGRAGIRAAVCDHVTIRNNLTDQNQRWGIFTSFCDDLLIENNETSRSGEEHGIYTSNSGDRPVIRGNRVWGNSGNGIHMNGDANFEGDGMISGALVEDNIIYGNGMTGGSAINCDGVKDSVYRNNLIYGNLATGIALYRIDGAAGSTDNLVINNTIVMPGDNRWAIRIRDGSTGNTVRNNILWNGHSLRGGIDITDDSLAGFSSDYNAVIDRFTTDDASSILTLAQWQEQTGQDANSFVATPDQLFVNPAEDDYQLREGSPAIDSGNATDAPQRDVAGNARPQGESIDIGAFESCPAGVECKTPRPGRPGAGGGNVDGGCGCHGGEPSGAAWLCLLVLGLLAGRPKRAGCAR